MIALLEKLVALLARLNTPIGIWARTLAGAFLAVMTVLVLFQIALRAGFGLSLAWTEEAARVLLVWSGFLIIPYAHRTGANVAIDVFTSSLPLRLQRALTLLLNLIILLICILFLEQAFLFWQRGHALQSQTMDVALSWFYSVVPFAFAALVLVSIELSLRNLLALLNPAQEYRILDLQPNEAQIPRE
jgi:TRAP-type C4-dicarboxylate transport system permease small subunit